MPLLKICPRCGTPNREARLNCARCGGPIAAVDPTDSATLPRDVLEAAVTTDSIATGSVRPRDGRSPDQGVVVTGIEIPFFDLVWLLVKLAIAAVPALFIVGMFWALLWALLAGFIGFR